MTSYGSGRPACRLFLSALLSPLQLMVLLQLLLLLLKLLHSRVKLSPCGQSAVGQRPQHAHASACFCLLPTDFSSAIKLTKRRSQVKNTADFCKGLQFFGGGARQHVEMCGVWR